MEMVVVLPTVGSTQLMGMATADAMILFGGIDEVEVHRESADNANCRSEVTAIDDACDLVIESGNFGLQLGYFSGRRPCQCRCTIPQLLTIAPQPFHRLKESRASVLPNHLPQYIAQDAD